MGLLLLGEHNRSAGRDSPADGSIIVEAWDFSPDVECHLIPYEWLFALPLLYRKRNPACGWTKSGPWPVEILTAFGRNLRAKPADGKARRTFVLRALFTLAAIYSRGTCRPTTIDVLMFHFRVRNGTGWGHQAMTTRLLPYFVLPTLYFVLQFA